MSAVAATPTQVSPSIASETRLPLSMREVLRIDIMRRLWYSQLISVFGDFLALFAVIGVLAFKLHATPQVVTGVQIAYLLPVAVLGILAGVFVDRWPIKLTLVASDAIRAALVLLLIFAHRPWHFYVVLAAISIVSSFFSPAQGVAIRFVVPLHGLRSANSLMQQVMFGMRILGPAVAGFMVAALGARSCYVLDSLSFVGSACLIASVNFLKPDGPPPAEGNIGQNSREAPPAGKVWADMGRSFGLILHHAGLVFVILAMASGMFVIGCFGPLIAIYVRDSLHAHIKIFGTISPMVGIGVLLGINGLSRFGKKLSNTLLVSIGLCGIAVGLSILAVLPHVWSTLLGTLIIGFAVAGIIVPSQTLVQQVTPPELIGRVGATFMSIVFTAQVSGLVLSGILAQHLGVRQVFALCAGMLVLLVVGGKIWMEPKTDVEKVS
jgi:DHA3 family macrolide efflux protein-like MFS transporter